MTDWLTGWLTVAERHRRLSHDDVPNGRRRIVDCVRRCRRHIARSVNRTEHFAWGVPSKLHSQAISLAKRLELENFALNITVSPTDVASSRRATSTILHTILRSFVHSIARYALPWWNANNNNRCTRLIRCLFGLAFDDRHPSIRIQKRMQAFSDCTSSECKHINQAVQRRVKTRDKCWSDNWIDHPKLISSKAN